MEPLATRYPICDSVTMASHCHYGIPFPFASTSTHPNHGCTLCSDCLIPGGLVFDYFMEIWDPPDTINLGMMCSAPVALYRVYFSWNGRIWKETMWGKVWSRKGRMQSSHPPLGREFSSPAKEGVHLLMLMIVC
nr:uncharacterized protein LOC112005114 [Quercus suber]